MTRSTNPLILPPGGGRRYAMGRIENVFKADDEVFYVLGGTATFLVADEWVEAPEGTFLMIPAATTQGFRTGSDEPAGVLNVFIPGGSERNTPDIVRWLQGSR